MDRRDFVHHSMLGGIVLPSTLGTLSGRADLFDTLLGEYLHAWRRSTAYLMRVAAALPESDYDFRPAPEVRSFAEHVVHLSMTTYGFTAIVRAEDPPAADRFDRGTRRKSELIDQLSGACAYAEDGLLALTAERATETVPWGGVGYEDVTELPVLAVVNVLRLHTAHHRAQMSLILRIKGIEPPPYVD